MELEREKELRRVEEERIRKILHEEREREQTSVDPINILRALGLAPPASVSEQVRDPRLCMIVNPELTVLKGRFGRQPNTCTSPSCVHYTSPSPIRPSDFHRPTPPWPVPTDEDALPHPHPSPSPHPLAPRTSLWWSESRPRRLTRRTIAHSLSASGLTEQSKSCSRAAPNGVRGRSRPRTVQRGACTVVRGQGSERVLLSRNGVQTQ